MSYIITIRRADPSDLPQMASVLIRAFSPGPWSRYLFPPHLRVKPGNADEFDFRLHMLSSKFGSPGREHVCATIQYPGEEKEVVVGWAQWIDPEGQMGLDEEKTWKKAGKEGDSAVNMAGLDREALGRLTREGELLEKRLEEYLGEDGTKQSRLLNLLLIDPSHQREGLGRLLAQNGLIPAARAGKSVRLRSTPEGRPLYLSLGFEDVCQQEVIGQMQYGMVWRAPVDTKMTA
ncbi:hypothetical protein VMCG_05565 [Cytospora schulzeri]|uniref:N-acetyltransferase domain-containing protein n=1 Tax=Cytospora schulzeri TaxID=448051 RepID=A0A423WEK5_9PEZI|nr:hypothetical protein VMCG_05565 [Valsa malicola]